MINKLKSSDSVNTAWSIVEFSISATCTWLVYRSAIATAGLSELGRWATAVAFVVFFRAFDVGAAPSITRDVALAISRGQKEETFSIACTGLIITTTFSLAVGLAGSTGIWIYAYVSDKAALTKISGLLPMAYGSYFLLSLSMSLAAALGGAGQWRVKSKYGVFACLIQATLASILLPKIGVIALGVAQAVQYAFLVVSLWISCLKYFKKPLATNPLKYFSRKQASSIFVLAVKVQTTNLAGFVFDPLVRMTLATSGSFAVAGAYDVALKVILQLKAALQMVVQTVSQHFVGLGRSEANVKGRVMYSYVIRAIAVSVTSFVALSYLIGYPVMRFALGAKDPQVATFMWVVGIGYGLNTLAMPSYFVAVARNYIRWNFVGHIVMLLSFALASWWFAPAIGGHGIVILTSICVFVGSAIVIVGNSFAFDLPPLMRRLAQ